jgi:hypothetical protein
MGDAEIVRAEGRPVEEVPAAAVERRDPWRKWMWWALGLLLAAQFYYFQEMFAAFLIFTVLFVIAAVFLGIVYLAGLAGEVGFSAAEPIARRGLAVADEVRKRTFRRPHSAPAP